MARRRSPGRGTNVALLIVLLAAFVSGGFVFAASHPAAAAAATLTHGALGLAVVALMPWKSVVIRRTRVRRAGSLTLLALLTVCVLAGVVQVLTGYVTVAGVSPVQVHVGAALLILPLLSWHVARSRRQRLRRADWSRRALLRGAVIGAAATTALGGVTAAAQVSAPARPRAPTGSRPLPLNRVPATIWLFDDTPTDLDPDTHRVTVAGRSILVADLAERVRPVTARLDCTSGWCVDATWLAIPLAELLPSAALDGTDSVVVRSVTGYVRRFPLSVLSDLYLATGLVGRPMTAGLGAPVRLVAPGYRGFWWVKWVASVEPSGRPAWWQPPFPPS